GIALNKKNTELLEKINGALAQLHENGTYDKIYQNWFGAN
ncbi:MAG: transporter substrate-binding domain-containing protein, partial [Firmicutes bacterium]|nr:transporter substrate-binding domain-containing protein [Bacillota bacterium]